MQADILVIFSLQVPDATIFSVCNTVAIKHGLLTQQTTLSLAEPLWSSLSARVCLFKNNILCVRNMIQWVSKIKTDGLTVVCFIPRKTLQLKSHVLYTLNKNLPSFMKYKIVYMIYNGL